MKTHALLPCLTVALLVWLPPTSSADEAGPVAVWTFDGSLEDPAGAVHDDLTAQGPDGAEQKARFVAAEEAPGVLDGAVALGVEPGDAQYLTAAVSDDVQLGPNYTIEAWIQPTQVGPWNRLVLQWGSGPVYAYHLALHNGVVSLCHGQADGQYIFCEAGPVVVDQIQHIAGVARRNDRNPAESTLTVYLNGRVTATAAFDGTIGRINDALGLGDSGSRPGAGSRFQGYVDEISIWNRALSAEEIKARCEAPGRAEAVRRSELVRERVQQERLRAELAQRQVAIARLQELGIEEIVFAERGYGRDISGHYYANFGYACGDPDVWFHADDGTRLVKLNFRTGRMTALVDDPGGSIRDPQIHYDAEKVLFSYRPGGTHRYHLHEVNLDGSNLRQLTDGDYDDVEATYLPDGDIVFCSTRCHRWIGCWLAETAILHRCDGNGENIRMLSSGSFTENTPSVLPDGRILYTRWEYVNRDPVSFHHLWTINPDGAGQMVYYGNMRPGGVFIDAKPIPGTNDIVLANIPGHGSNEHRGFVAVASGGAGPNNPASMRNVSKSTAYRDPDPLSADMFLVVANQSEIVLMNASGETEPLYTGQGRPLHEPRAVVRRPREQVVSPRTDLALASATVFLSDVYTGRNMRGIEPGAIKRLLVLEDLPKPANFHGGGSQPIGHGVTSTIKRILGTVPVEADGSACFEIPPMRSIYFALLDERGRSIKQMRSFVTLQPGETLSCVGCHEPREQTPDRRSAVGQMAIRRPPSVIQPIVGQPEIVDFPRDVQPILDRHCVECHKADRPEGQVVLSGDRGPVFSLSYYAMYLHWQIKDTTGNPGHGTGRQPGNDEPYSTYSSASPLMDKLESSHHDVRLAELERQTLRLWVDVGATYPGTYAAYGTGQIGGSWWLNQPIREMADDWPSTGPAVEAVTRRCGACHPAEQLPYHVTALTRTNVHRDMLSWTRPLSRYSRHRVFNLTRPEKSRFLMAPLSKQAGGYAQGDPVIDVAEMKPITEDRSRPPESIVHPIVFADATDPDYQAILAHLRAAGARLDEIKRFDMPGFRPNEHYVREMKRYGVLAPSFDLASDPIDVYAVDRAYWRSFWAVPLALHSEPLMNAKER